MLRYLLMKNTAFLFLFLFAGSSILISQTYNYRNFNLEPGVGNTVLFEPGLPTSAYAPQINLTASWTNTDSLYNDLYKASYVLFLSRTRIDYRYDQPFFNGNNPDVMRLNAKALVNTIGFGFRYRLADRNNFFVYADLIPAINRIDMRGLDSYPVSASFLDANGSTHTESWDARGHASDDFLSFTVSFKAGYRLNRFISCFIGVQSVARSKSLHKNFHSELNNFSRFSMTPSAGLKFAIHSKAIHR